MSNINYPPIIESKLPAFVKKETNTIVSIPFKLSKAVNYNDFDSMQLRIKTITTGVVKYNPIVTKTNISYNLQNNSYVAMFNIGNANNLTAGQFYKAQLAFIDDGINSPWSSVGIIKCTNPIEITIDDLQTDINNNNPVDFLGRYQNTDTTEKVYSYCFTIYDENNQVFETSGDLIHNSETDEIAGGKYIATDTWSSKRNLVKGKIYRIVYSVKTINDYKAETSPYSIKEANTVDAHIPAKLLAVPDFDNGGISLKLIKPKELSSEQPITGNFVISRYSDDIKNWNEICRFNMLSQTPSDMGILWIDYTVEHGVKYLYSIQAYNSNNLYSNRMIQVIENPNNKNDYLELDLNGEPYYLMADYEDAFLTDENRQLRIRYNPKVSSFKSNILESKVDTLGGKYPFIFRNGNVEYKEFPISGLLSYLSDEKELFMQGIRPIELDLRRQGRAAAGMSRSQASAAITDAGTKLTSDNFYRERQFKMEVLEWLNNGQPKLFRSPGEGNYIVRLMNVSLSPNDTLGRMLHTFNATAYEIADYNFDNLNTYNLLHLPNEDNRTMKFVEHKIGSVFEPGYNMYNVFIINADPGTKYNLTQVGPTTQTTLSIEIGATGAYYVPNTSYPITKIAADGEIAPDAMVNYGYYDVSVPDNFGYISNITSKDEITQLIGRDDKVDIISQLEDIRRDVGDIYTLIIRPRPVETIYKIGNSYSKASSYLERVDWSDITIYKYNDAYYNNNPDLNNKVQTNDLGEVEYYCKLNNLHMLDLSTGSTYPNTGNDIFAPATQGCYWLSNDFGEVKTIHLSAGVYIDIAYELKEIEYSIEQESAELQTLKQRWINSQNQSDYEAYIKCLEEILKEVYQEGYNYAL